MFDKIRDSFSAKFRKNRHDEVVDNTTADIDEVFAQNKKHSRYTKWQKIDIENQLITEYINDLVKWSLTLDDFIDDFGDDDVNLVRVSRIIALEMQNRLYDKPWSFTKASYNRSKKLVDKLTHIEYHKQQKEEKDRKQKEAEEKEKEEKEKQEREAAEKERQKQNKEREESEERARQERRDEERTRQEREEHKKREEKSETNNTSKDGANEEASSNKYSTIDRLKIKHIDDLWSYRPELQSIYASITDKDQLNHIDLFFTTYKKVAYLPTKTYSIDILNMLSAANPNVKDIITSMSDRESFTKGFRQAALFFHPDRNQKNEIIHLLSAECIQKFNDAVDAYKKYRGWN
jgi:chemotaxis protein histidine kinase CheA